MLVSALALCIFCVTTKLSRQRAENVRSEVADAAGNRQLKHGARQPEVGFLQPEVGFLQPEVFFATGSGFFASMGSGFTQIFGKSSL